ncbi:phosphatase PAP2 family protein [Natronococcus sp.]|uniref:phosphatase PAP2 family protein n=1 Tax=Natronococcus sp. TaxID=35747 RepID=UPI003A4D8341
MRFETESAVIREAFPTAYAELAIVITELGGQSVLMLVLATLFWVSNRRRSALVIAYAFAGFSLLLALKAALGVARPPEELFLKPLASDEYGFPSGHAFAATVVYGGLVSAYDRVGDPATVAGAVALILSISLSRVVLGVHYLGDVLVGVVLGVAFLIAMNRLTRGSPRRAFAVAVALSVPALAIVGPSPEAMLGFGGSVGGLAVSNRIDRLPARRSRLEGVVLVVGIILTPAAVGRLETDTLGGAR